MDAPLVTIIAVCHNHKDYVLETLESIRNQTYSNIELIVISNLMEDGCKEAIAQWITENKYDCIFIQNNEPKGLCENLNSAIEKSNGKYIQGISCDDVLYLDKITKQVDILEQSPEKTALVYSNLTRISQKGDIIGEVNFSTFSNKGYHLKKRGSIYHDLLKVYYLRTPSILLRKTVFDKVKGFDKELSIEDVDFYLRVCQRYEVEFLDEPTVYYRVLPTSLYHSKNPEKTLSLLKTYQKHLSNNPVATKIAKKHIASLSLKGYKEGLKGMSYWLMYRAKYYKDLTSFTLLLTCTLGIRYQTIITIKRLFFGQWFKNVDKPF